MKKKFQEYYTESNEILKCMIDFIEIVDGDIILEPCFGGGAFVDKILELNKDIRMECHEINPNALIMGEKKYNDFRNLEIIETDILLDERLKEFEKEGYFDKVIGNPPYGAWLEIDLRKKLKKEYPFLYTKETYIVFLYKMIKLLKNKGKLSFIIPDTFLNLHNHSGFREKLWREVSVKEIIIFPSKFFPGINYGYSNMCIINIEKNIEEKTNLNNIVKIYTKLNNSCDLLNLKEIDEKNIKYFLQEELYNNMDYAVFLDGNRRFIEFLNTFPIKLGDIANCVTGIYTGDDKTYLKVINNKVKNGSKNEEIIPNEIQENPLEDKNILNGIVDIKNKLELIKGAGQSRYKKRIEWYIDWSREAVSHYKVDKKARFQNSSYYFKKGLGIPMVKSKKINTFIIENKVFDQSVVGIFPYNEKYLFYLLALLNSTVVNKIINIINPTANNSANYLKKIPVIIPDEKIINKINSNIILILELMDKDNEKVTDLESKNDDMINKIYNEYI